MTEILRFQVHSGNVPVAAFRGRTDALDWGKRFAKHRNELEPPVHVSSVPRTGDGKPEVLWSNGGQGVAQREQPMVVGDNHDQDVQ